MKTSELTGVALDWAVAKCEEETLEIERDMNGRLWLFLPLGFGEDYREA